MNVKTDFKLENVEKSILWDELRVIKRGQKRPDGLFGSFMTRPVSHIVAYIFHKVNFTPNMVTFLSFLFCLTSCASLLVFKKTYTLFIITASIWWIGAVLDAADGDLARYINKGSLFGGWFDSYLDRLKEFLVFGTFGYLAFKNIGLSTWGNTFEIEFSNEFYLFLGFLSMLTNVMSGWISDTKKIFCNGQRNVEIKLNNKYMIGMADTRDFFVILSLLTFEFRIALYLYGIVFPFVLMIQTGLFLKRYGSDH